MTRSDRSSWSCSASRVDVISLKTFVSLAKAAIWLDLTTSGRDFTYRRNNMGPKIDPCGTPEVTAKGLDVALKIVTRWDRLCRYDSSRLAGSPLTPYWCSFHRSNLRGLLCQRVLTCPDKLYRLVHLYPALCQFGLKLQQAGLHKIVAMKPCWHALIRLKTWSLIAVNMHRYMTPGTIESSEIGV